MPLKRVVASFEPVEFAPKVVSVGVDCDRQGQEGCGLKPLAELLRQRGHLRGVAFRLMPHVESVVSR